MALAIPIIALGTLFIISNSNNQENDEKEGFTNTDNVDGIRFPNDNTDNYFDKATNNVNLNNSNYPIASNISENNINRYANPNQNTDKYFKQKENSVTSSILNNNPPGSVGSGNQQQMSLTGEPIDNVNFTHNNMTPFFGAKVKGATLSGDQAESKLDNMQGGGSQHNRKVEVSPLFKPTTSMQHNNGAPNNSDFIQSRMNTSLKQNNFQPFESQQVAPGLDKGYNSTGGVGFNTGMEARDKWLPKTVDDLRVDNNPKVTFDLNGHQGPANSHIKESGNIKTQGKVEQYNPDTYYTVGKDRWFTTTGIQKAPSARSNEIVPDTNRIDTSTDYYGAQTSQTNASYTKGEYKTPNRPVLKPNSVTNLSVVGQNNGSANDYGKKGYKTLPNNRSTTSHVENLGGINGMIGAVIAPLLDVMRPSRKENVIGNLRPIGNAGSSVAQNPIWNPEDKTRITNRETTEGATDGKYLNIGRQGADGYTVNKHQPVNVQRDTTNREHIGNLGPSSYKGKTSYDAAYKQRNNVNKTYKNHANQGGTQIFNQQANICIAKNDTDRNNNRMWVPNLGTTTVPSKDTYGKINGPCYDNAKYNEQRLEPNLLNAFKDNPFTHSLTSSA
tara:strand:+ start:9683 stop:11521 length:1839 start_codon:yes stop_codon:yes gene_type:complete